MGDTWRQLELFPYGDPMCKFDTTDLSTTSRLYLLAHGPLTTTGRFALEKAHLGDLGTARAGTRAIGTGISTPAGGRLRGSPGNERDFHHSTPRGAAHP